MNPLAFSLALADNAQADELVASIAAAGFDGFEPTFIPDDGLPCIADPRGSAEKARKLADKHGLKIPSMRGGPRFWPTFGSPDKSQREQAVKIARAAFEALKIMGADTLLIVPGQWSGEQTYESLWNNAVDTAKRIADVAGEMDMHVGLENVENRFLLSPRDWMQFLDEVASPRLRMYFDVGNVVYNRLGYPDRWMEQLGRTYIHRIHFKDATHSGELKYLLEGDVDWPAAARQIAAMQYDDWIGIELILPHHHAQAMLESTCLSAKAILENAR